MYLNPRETPLHKTKENLQSLLWWIERFEEALELKERPRDIRVMAVKIKTI